MKLSFGRPWDGLPDLTAMGSCIQTWKKFGDSYLLLAMLRPWLLDSENIAVHLMNWSGIWSMRLRPGSLSTKSEGPEVLMAMKVKGK